MLSSVSITGVLGRPHDTRSNVRYLNYESMIPSLAGQTKSFEIPVIAPCGPGSYFMAAEQGAYVFLKGRLDFDEELGLALIHEFDEFLSFPSPKKKQKAEK